MANRILVETLAQPTWSCCFQTCVVMLLRHASRRWGLFHPISELEERLFLGRQRVRCPLLTPRRARALAETHGLVPTYIDVETPRAFSTVLSARGPFIYVGDKRGGFGIRRLRK